MDKRIQKTKQQLYVGLKNLLNKMDYGQINVQNLLDESNISRSTFYSHYKSKDDVLLSIVNDLFDHVFSHTLEVEETHDFSKNSILEFSHLITHILYHLHDEKEMIQAIINNTSCLIFFQEMRKRILKINEIIIEEKNVKNKIVPYKLALEIANENFIVLIKHWFRYDCAASPETITTYYFSLIS
ncbi:MAG: TetR/AcrR family transcriptional regulator [Mollicutes bacterium]|nr:TetR/AcrR family transcriptional regulator [Mollicutes bacterium]MDD7263904.1 TetR/AcrR family transcriptional regulator [bacterium]MDY4980092.1 TetR/AcrR family transcriptional regulator [Candidatus Onthovivens sp.]